jgi:integrase
MRNRDGTPSALSGEAAWQRYQEFRLSEGATIEEINAEAEAIKAAVASGLQAKPRSTKTRPRGTGSLYRRKGSRFFWCQYFVNKTVIRESTGSETRKGASDFLQKKLIEIGAGRALDPEAGKARISDLVEEMFFKKRHGIIEGGKSVDLDEPRWKTNLKPFFGEMTVKQLTKQVLGAYVNKRKAQKAANATVNKELNIVRSALKAAEIELAVKWPRLPETNIRKEFLEDHQYPALAEQCQRVGTWLRAMLAVGVSVGWRKAELMTLKVSQVDLIEKLLRLDTSKNSEGRTVPLNQECYQLIVACVANKNPDDYVFTYSDGSPVFRMEQGRPVATFRKAWATACKNAGVPGLLFHSLRRTSARNNRRLGVSEDVILKMSGWKTRSMFSRYNIVNADDLREAVKRQDEKRAEAMNGFSNYRKDTVEEKDGSSSSRRSFN